MQNTTSKNSQLYTNNDYNLKILKASKENLREWQYVKCFKEEIEINGFSYSEELEEELIKQMLEVGTITLMWYCYKVVEVELGK